MRFKYEDLKTAPLIVDSIYEGGTESNIFKNDPLTKLFEIDGYKKSVGTQGGFRKSLKENNDNNIKKIAYSVIYSSGQEEHWPNYYDKSRGIFIYYGDNRVPGKNYLQTKQKGNELLKDIFLKAYESAEARKNIPPLFVFEATGVGRNVKFLGVAVPGVKDKPIEETLMLETFGEGNNQFQNYKAFFTMINIEPEGVSKEWIAQLKDYKGDPLKYAPQEWLNFVQYGVNGVSALLESNMRTIDDETEKILPSEKQYLQKVRQTQGIFREKLLQKDPRCKICGMNLKDLLIASHSKPWKDSDDKERVNIYNGFLFCPDHNALYDAGYITFSKDGNIIITDYINDSNREKFRIDENIKIEIKPEHIEYLEWHKKNVFKGKKDSKNK